MGNSHGEQVTGQDFTSHEYAGLKQSNTPTYSTCITQAPSKCCVHFEATLVPCTCTCISYIFCNTTWAFIQKHDILMCESNIYVHIAAGTACNTVLIWEQKSSATEGMSVFTAGMSGKLNLSQLPRHASSKDLWCFFFAGGIMSSYVRVVSQAVSAAMSQVLRRHTCMRTRLNASYFLF